MADGGTEMEKSENNQTLKMIAFLGIVAYVYFKFMRVNGGTLKGNPEGWKMSINSDMVVDTVFPFIAMNPDYRDVAKFAVKKVLRSLKNKHGVDYE